MYYAVFSLQRHLDSRPDCTVIEMTAPVGRGTEEGRWAGGCNEMKGFICAWVQTVDVAPDCSRVIVDSFLSLLVNCRSGTVVTAIV